MKQLIAQWQNKGETVVFTNGCFDILHRGHITYLQEAAQLGDHLIIGLNSDASVRRERVAGESDQGADIDGRGALHLETDRRQRSRGRSRRHRLPRHPRARLNSPRPKT